MEEVWKDIEGYKNFKASNKGRIYMKEHKYKMPNGGYKTVQGKIKTQSITKNGYLYIQHKIKGKNTILYVHRLIAKAFPEVCGKWFDGCQVDHLNTIRTDNNIYNLRVCTAKENQNNKLTIQHIRASKIGKKMSLEFKEKQRIIQLGKKLSKKTKNKISESLRNSDKVKKRCKSVIQYDVKTGEKIKEYKSMREAERQTGVFHTTISKCCKLEFKQAGGFIWKYGKK